MQHCLPPRRPECMTIVTTSLLAHRQDISVMKEVVSMLRQRAARAVLLVILVPRADSRLGDGDSTFECSSSEPWVGPFAYGSADPVPQQRCVAQHVQLSSDPPVLHAFVQDMTLRERMQRSWGHGESTVEFHMHTMDLPLVVHDEPLPPCAQELDTAVAFSVPDLSNLYHTFFDLLVPLQDTLASLNLSNPALLALHDPVITRAQPWLTPIRRFGERAQSPGTTADAFFETGDSWDIETEAPTDSCRLDEGNGRTSYQFLDHFGALVKPTFRWLTAPPFDFPDDHDTQRKHDRCLRRFELHRQDGTPKVALPLPDVLRTYDKTTCIKELHLNLRLRSSLWQYEHTTLSSEAHSFIFLAFKTLFREHIPRQFGLFPLVSSDLGTSENKLSAVVLVRTKRDTRPTKNAGAVEQAVQTALARVAPSAKITVNVLDAAALSLHEQVRTFSRCMLLVGDHGAGLSNAVFMPAGAAVVELTHTACGIHCGDYFRPVAELSGVRHWRFGADNLTVNDVDFNDLLDDSITVALNNLKVRTNNGGVSGLKREF